MASRRRKALTITDTRAMRALAHPARQRLIDELSNRATLTATEAAQLVGLTPSATSHHLRALEKYGLAERATSSGDGRERPWRAAPLTINFDPGPSVSGQAAVQALVGNRLDRLRDLVATYLTSAPLDPWKVSFRGLTWKDAWVTEAEAQELQQRLDQALNCLPRGRTARNRPPDSRRISVALSVLPIPSSTEP